MIVDILSQGLGCQQDIVSDGEGGVLVGGAAPVSPVFCRIHGGEAVTSQHNLRCIQEIGLGLRQGRLLSRQGLLDIAVHLLFVKSLQSGELFVIVLQNLRYAGGKVYGFRIGCAESIVLRGLVQSIKPRDGLIAVVHKARAHHEACHVGDAPGAVVILCKPAFGIGVSGLRVHIPGGSRRIQGSGDIGQNRIIIAAGPESVQGQGIAFRIRKTQAVEIGDKCFRFQLLEPLLEGGQVRSSLCAAFICQVHPPPGVGQVRVLDVRDGAVELGCIDIVRIGAGVGAVGILRNAQGAGFIHIFIVLRHVSGSAENGAHLPAAGGADGDDLILISRDHIFIGSKLDDAGL